MSTLSDAVVLFGATGDLARKKLFPALHQMVVDGSLADGVPVIGVSSSEWSDEELRARIRESVAEQVEQPGPHDRALLPAPQRGLEQHPGLEDLADVAPDSGEGRWTVQTAVDTGVPVPAIAASLWARFESQTEQSLTMKAVAALREQFGGHAVVVHHPQEDPS